MPELAGVARHSPESVTLWRMERDYLQRAISVMAVVTLLGLWVSRVSAATFTAEVNLSDSPAASLLNEINPQAVAADGQGRVIVVWSEFTTEGGTPELMARVRQPDGRWSKSALLTPRDGKYSGDAALATTADGRVAVAWVDQGSGSFEVRLAFIDPLEPKLLESQAISEPTLLLMEPAIAAGPKGEIAIAWTVMEEMNYELRLRRRAPDGKLGPVEPVTPQDKRASDQISLAYGPDSRLHLAWADSRGGARRIFYGSLAPGDIRKPFEISPMEGDSKQTRPVVAVDPGGGVHIAWQESRGDSERVYVASAGAERFSSPIPIGLATSFTRSPSLLASDSGVHLLWEDGRHSQGEEQSIQIYYARLGGGRLSEETAITTDLPVSCFNPSLGAGTVGKLHLVWRNAGFGEGDVFYREGTASGPWAPN